MTSVRADSRSSPPHGQRGQPGDDVVALGAAHAEQDDDRVGREPPRGEDERVRRRRVGQVQVVDHDGDRAVLGVPADQAQHRRADREPVARLGRALEPRGERERGGQRIRLHRRDPVERAERRAQQLQQRPERDLPLRLEAGRTQHPHLVESVDGVVEQRGLSDPGLAGESEHAARSQAGRGHEPVDRLLLGLPTHQHAPSLGARHGRGSPLDATPDWGGSLRSKRVASGDLCVDDRGIHRQHRTEGAVHVHHRRSRPRSTPTS